MIQRILAENRAEWDEMLVLFQSQNMQARVQRENSTETLHELNVALANLYDRVMPYHGKARAYKDALERLIDRTIKGYNEGKNEAARRSGGIQLCREYVVHYPNSEYVCNLFDLQDDWAFYFEQLDAIVRSIRFKSDAKITNNSLLNLERNLM
ncbi:hypothetical protein C0431_12850 [bacterium]|nr:hypothetical protein [bacterium]